MQVTFEIDDDEISKLVRRELVWLYRTYANDIKRLESAEEARELQGFEKEDLKMFQKVVPALEVVIAQYTVGGEFDPSEIEDEDEDDEAFFVEDDEELGLFDEDNEGTEDDLK